jgi:preprotein translocase subunit SecB
LPIAPAQLEGAWLGRVLFEPNPLATGEDAPHNEYFVHPEVNIEDPQRDEDGSLAAVLTLTATVSFSRTDGAEGPLPFLLELDVHGVFRWSASQAPQSDDLARGWLDYNGMYLLWPYLRSYVTVITGFSHLPALTLYTMNVPNPPVIPDEQAHSAEDAGAEQETTTPGQVPPPAAPRK